jgi:hypothetical protein
MLMSSTFGAALSILIGVVVPVGLAMVSTTTFIISAVRSVLSITPHFWMKMTSKYYASGSFYRVDQCGSPKQKVFPKKMFFSINYDLTKMLMSSSFRECLRVVHIDLSCSPRGFGGRYQIHYRRREKWRQRRTTHQKMAEPLDQSDFENDRYY